eukprot:865285-Rhodomonas_salina.1
MLLAVAPRVAAVTGSRASRRAARQRVLSSLTTSSSSPPSASPPLPPDQLRGPVWLTGVRSGEEGGGEVRLVRRVEGGGEGAVSYTHLRAHETEADL